METNNNENLNNIPNANNVQAVPHTVNPTVQEKPSIHGAILSLVFGIIGTILSVGIGFFFLLMLALFVGYVLVSEPLYIIICSIIALIGSALGITSIILGAKSIRYHTVISIFGILAGLASTATGFLDLLMFCSSINF